MESIYRQYYDEPRFRPSVITAQRLAAGALGRKTGEGFYRYATAMQQTRRGRRPPSSKAALGLGVHRVPRAAPSCFAWSRTLGAQIETGPVAVAAHSLILVAPLGFDVTTVAAVERLDATRTVGIDLLIDDAATKRRVLATNPATRPDMRDAAHALFARDGKAVSVIRDSGGFVTQRVIAAIVNIASDMCQQRVCSPPTWKPPCTLGLGYPRGPLAMGNLLGPGQHARGAVQHADRVRRPALSPEPVAAPPRCAWACRCCTRRIHDDRPNSRAPAMAAPWC
jgi:3-hydroxybutyryl-CoA dehydrogenase